MKLRLVLVILAATTLWGLLQLTRFNAERSPATLRDEARDVLTLDEPDYDAAFRALERALELAQEADDDHEVRAVELEQARTYRRRWELSRTQWKVVHTDADLEEVIRLCDAWAPGPGEYTAQAMTLGAMSAIDLRRPSVALGFLERLRAFAPDEPGARLLFAKAHIRAADETLANSVPMEWLAAAQEAAIRTAEDPRRAARVEKIRTALVGDALSAALAAIDEASEHFAVARRTYLRMLEDGANGFAIGGVQRLLVRVQAYDKAITVGRFALTTPSLSSPSFVWQATMKALVESGRLLETQPEMDELIGRKRPFKFEHGDLDDDELYELCRVFHRAQAWTALRITAYELSKRHRIVSEPEHRVGHSDFLLGIGLVHTSEPEKALPALLKVPTVGPEPIPGMRLELYRGLAIAHAALGNSRSQREALRRAEEEVPYFPQSPRMRALAGEVWLMHGEIHAAEQDWIRAEDELARAICLLPKREQEITPLWEEVGKQAIAKRDRSLADVRLEPNKREFSGRLPPMGSYESCLRAELAVERGHPDHVTLAVQPALDDYPGLPAAMRVLATSEFQRGRLDLCIETTLALVELGYERGAELDNLTRIPADRFTGDQIRRWMLQAPIDAGFTRVVDHLVRSGNPDLTRKQLATAGHTGNTALAGDQRVHVAHAYNRIGNTTAAFEWLDAFPAGAEELGRNVELLLCTALAAEETEEANRRLRAAVVKLADCERWDDPAVARGIDAVLAAGDVSTAFELMRQFESAPGTTLPARAEMSLRAGIGHLLANRRAEASEAFERADGQREDSLAQLGRVVLALPQTAAESRIELDAELRLTIHEILTTPYAFPPFKRAVLTAIGGDIVAARGQLEAIAVDEGEHVELALSWIDRHADGAGLPGDVVKGWNTVELQFALTMLIAAGERPFAPWVLEKLRRLPADVRSTPAGAYLAARSWRSLGQPDRFRTPALPDAATIEFEDALADARSARSAGELANAVERFDDLVDNHTAVMRPHVGEFIALIREARLAAALEAEGEWATLEALGARYPEHPAPPRTLAELILSRGETANGQGLERARRLLERFRQQTDGRALELLGAGEAGRWSRLLRYFDTDRAERFMRAELNAVPAAPDVWGDWCEALAANGQWPDALDAYGAILTLAETPELVRGAALLRISLGKSEAGDADVLLSAVRDSAPDLAMRYAIALLAGATEQEPRRAATDAAQELWARADRNRLDFGPFARALAAALHPAQPDEAVAILDQALEQVQGPIERLTLRAMRLLLGQS